MESAGGSREVVIRSGGRDLAGHVFDPGGAPSSGAGLLFVHGLRSDQAGYRRRAQVASAALGAVCLTFDLSGHGKSQGDLDELTPREHLADVLAAYDVLTGNAPVGTGRVGVCAASYGAYLAALLVSRRPVERLLLRAPALYADDDLDTPLGRRRASRADVRAPVLFQGLAGFGGDIMVLESERDEVIPHAVVEAYLEAFPRARHDVIAGATHALTEPAWQEQLVASILGWFGEL